jgi:hypothetical protein
MIVQLEGDIRARAIADSTLTALLGAATSVYNLVEPEDTAFPYIVYEVVTAENDSTFRTAREKVDFRIKWVVEERPDAGTPDPVTRGRAIEMRLFGDWTAQAAGTAPTFGFERWKPTLTGSGWTADICEHQRTVTAHAPGTLQWVMEFKLAVHKAGA